MPYMTDYLAEQFAPFERMPFCTLDATVLSQIAMIHAKDVVPLLPGDANQRAPAAFSSHARVASSSRMLQAEHYPVMFSNLLDPARPRAHCSA